MKEIAHQSWMSATPTSVAASVRVSVPCRSNRPTLKSMMMCSALTNIVARPTQSHTVSASRGRTTRVVRFPRTHYRPCEAIFPSYDPARVTHLPRCARIAQAIP
jgi:hypothetical protein